MWTCITGASRSNVPAPASNWSSRSLTCSTNPLRNRPRLSPPGVPPMPSVREVRAGGWCVRLDLSPQVLRLEIPEFIIGRGPWEDGEPLLPTPPLADGPVSAATLLLKAKQFDDGLYAA